MARLFGLLCRLRTLQHAQSLGDLRPLPIERGQPTPQGCNLSRDIIRACDRIVPFGCGCALKMPIKVSVASARPILRGHRPRRTAVQCSEAPLDCGVPVIVLADVSGSMTVEGKPFRLDLE